MKISALFSELLKMRIVFVSSEMIDEFTRFASANGVAVSGGAFAEDGQYFYC